MPYGRRSALLLAVVALTSATSSAHAADPVIAAAGDIACGPAETGVFPCQQLATSDLLLNIDPTAVLALGDNQYNSGSLADYNSFYQASWGRLKSITHPIVGNHEYGSPGLAGYFGYYGSAAGPKPDGYYSFDVGTWHIIALNSNCATRVDCSAGSAQETWLRNDLKAHPAACTLAFQHQPLWATPTFQMPEARPLFQALYDADAEVLLTGHDHLYDRFAPSRPDQSIDRANGVQQFIVGTGGRDFSGLGPENPNSEVRDNQSFGVLKLTLHPSSYDWQFMPTGGQGFTDFGSRACHGAGAPPTPAPPTLPTKPPTNPVFGGGTTNTGTPPALAPTAPALSPPENEDAESAGARLATRVSVSSVTISRRRVTVRGRLSTGASASRLRVTVSRRIRGRRLGVTRATHGGRGGSWAVALGLPRRLRGLQQFRVTLRYLGETSYAPARLTTIARNSFHSHG